MAITTNNLISRQTVGSAGAASITFSNIPQTFTDLRMVISSRVDYTGAWQNINIELNGDSGSNYTSKLLYGNGSAAGSDTSTTTFLKFVYSNFNTSTASVFSNGEMYFPNYRTATYKSVSSDSVTENNAATVLTALTAGIWNDTAAITTIKFTPNQGSFGEFTTFSLYGISSNTTTQNTSVPSATGGDVITTDGTYWYHAFKASGTFTPLKALTADCLVVAGGGGGGYWQNSGGGGGAGGLRGFTSQSLTVSNYAVTVGGGGAGSAGLLQAGSKGSDSTFNSSSSTGGGGGGSGYATTAGNATTGGSGGGGWAIDGGSQTAGAAGNQGGYSPVEGYAGGDGTSNVSGYSRSGGGGGAAAVGVVGSTSGNGGAGSSAYSSWGSATSTGQNVSGTYYYAGGGGGGDDDRNGQSVGSGGNGGGGNGGGGGGQTTAVAGTANTGGGAGGQGNNASPTTTRAGGSGIVVVRYAV